MVDFGNLIEKECDKSVTQCFKGGVSTQVGSFLTFIFSVITIKVEKKEPK
jgi:hypothetical protein